MSGILNLIKLKLLFFYYFNDFFKDPNLVSLDQIHLHLINHRITIEEWIPLITHFDLNEIRRALWTLKPFKAPEWSPLRFLQSLLKGSH